MFWAMNLILGIVFFTYFEGVLFKGSWLDQKRLGIYTHRYVGWKPFTAWFYIMMVWIVTFSCTNSCISSTVKMEMSEMATSKNAICQQPERQENM